MNKLWKWIGKAWGAFWTRMKGNHGFRTAFLKVATFLGVAVGVWWYWGLVPAVCAYVVGVVLTAVMLGLVPKYDFKLVRKKRR